MQVHIPSLQHTPGVELAGAGKVIHNKLLN